MFCYILALAISGPPVISAQSTNCLCFNPFAVITTSGGSNRLASVYPRAQVCAVIAQHTFSLTFVLTVKYQRQCEAGLQLGEERTLY